MKYLVPFDLISFVPYAANKQTDLTALKAAFDTNGNGVLDAGDAAWLKFGVWQDANSNGINEAGEFKSLTEMGISQIGLTSNGQFQIINGQSVHGTANYTKTDGTVVANGVADVTLRYKNITQVTTTNADGSTSTTQVTMPSQPRGEQFEGTDGNDAAFGTAGNDRIITGLGNDVIADDQGDDVAEAGAGLGAGDDYSQKRSELSPYDADIWQIKLKNWKIEAKTGRKPETPRACQRAGRRVKPIFQGKNKQCQRHMVIVRSEKSSKHG